MKRYKFSIPYRFFVGLAFFALCLFLFFSLTDFSTDLWAIEQRRANDSLQELADQGESMFQYKIDRTISSLESLAVFLADMNNFQSPEVLRHCQEVLEYNGLIEIGISNDQGTSMTTSIQVVDMSQQSFIQKSLKREVAISDLFENDEGPYFYVSVPIVSKDEVVGVIYGMVDTQHLSNELNPTDVQGSRYVHIVNLNGNYVVKSNHTYSFNQDGNLFEPLKNATFLQGSSYEEMKINIENGKSGTVDYRINEETRRAYYRPLAYNNWTLFTVYRTSALMENFRQVSQIVLFFAMRIGATLICFFLLIVGLLYKSKKQMALNNKELRASEESFMIALEETDHTVFLFDINTKELIFKTRRWTHFNMPLYFHDVPNGMIDLKILAPEYEFIFLEMFKKIEQKEKTASCVVKLNEKYNSIWERFTLTNIFDDEQHVLRTVGVIEDITEVKEKEENSIREKQYRKALLKDNLWTVEVNLSQRKIINMDKMFLEFDIDKSSYNEILKIITESLIVSDYHEVMLSQLSVGQLMEVFYQGCREFKIEVQCQEALHVFWVELNVCLFEEEISKEIHCMLYARNIEEAKKIEFLSQCDPLTKLLNRTTAEQRINLILKESKKSLHAFILLDLDFFKNINDNFGHTVGDQVLLDVSDRIRRCFRNDDIVSRLGGDEFFIFMRDIHHTENAFKAARKLASTLRLSYSDEEQTINISASIGVVIAPRDGNQFQQLYEKADSLLYRVKRQGKNNIDGDESNSD